METKDFLKEPLIDVIDVYFETFNQLRLSLWADIVENYEKKQDICSDRLEEADCMFLIDTDKLKKRISVELFSNPSSSIVIQRYITDKYDTIKSDKYGLIKWGDYYLQRLKNLSFPFKRRYLDNGTFAKQRFYERVLCNGFTNNHPKGGSLPPSEVKVTIGDFYSTILQEFETGYNAIMAIFTENSTYASTDKKGHQPDNSIRQFTEEQIELLKSYFIATFKGMGNSINYFDEYLLIDLKKKRDGIEYAKVARLIYESPKSIEGFKKRPFAHWYETFCNIMGIKKCQYRKSQIHIDDIKREFYYLT